jgi:tRNA-splicing ligase RtcB
VAEIFDGLTAREWGIKKGNLAVMVHTGSVELGHAVGSHFKEAAKKLFPIGTKHPENGFFPISAESPLAEAYLEAMSNAANFAFANRLFLGLMAVRACSEVLGRSIQARLVYDAPHNLIWKQGDTYLHRKGACPALGPDVLSPYPHTGCPVIIPGSMGSSSYLLAGKGNLEALQSACHGAGRGLSRGQARNVEDKKYEETFCRLRVVTPVDPKAADIRARRDILEKYHDSLKEEAPYAYKAIQPVIQTVVDSGIASKVVRLSPLMTVKG